MISLKKNKENAAISIKDEIGIEGAEELKTIIMQVINEFNEITIHFEKNKDFHSSIIQIILAAEKDMASLNKKLIIKDNNNALKNCFIDLGFINNEFIQKIKNN